eukprot:GHVU01107732.1.p1 GENE.GHVU01107732.1~~GHVU01107732.1.p1  ORF type:complete len:119 (+),score=9.89 GHVU01107732.1:259-615(+)
MEGKHRYSEMNAFEMKASSGASLANGGTRSQQLRKGLTISMTLLSPCCRPCSAAQLLLVMSAAAASSVRMSTSFEICTHHTQHAPEESIPRLTLFPGTHLHAPTPRGTHTHTASFEPT